MTLRRWSRGLVVGVALVGLPSGAVARPHASARATAAAKAEKSPRDATDRRTRDGEAALKAGDLVAAERLFSDAYRTHGAALALLQLGRVAQAQGRAVAALDFRRRFLAATEGQDLPPEQRAEAEQAPTAPLPAGEVAVLGEPGGRVLLDGHLVALLPLALPLLVAPGAHEVRLESAGSHAAAPLAAALTIQPERRVEVRFELATAAVMVSELPTVLLFIRSRGGPDTTEARLQPAVVERLRSQRLTALPAKMLAATGCTDGPRCQLATLTERALGHAVIIEVEAPVVQSSAKPAAPPSAKPGEAAAAPPSAKPGGNAEPPPTADFRFTVSLLDAQVGEVAHQLEQRCDHCTLEALAAQVATASSDVARQGLGRRHGELTVQSEPPGALLELSGRIVGPTPYHGVRFVGSYAAVLRHPGYRELSQPLVVEEGKPAELRVRLEPTAAPVPETIRRAARVSFVELGPRPRWRLLLGGGLIGGGAVIAGFGGGALAVDGQCVVPAMGLSQQCDRYYQTLPLGIGLVSGGAAVALIGAVLIALPGPRRRFESSLSLVPCVSTSEKSPAGAATPSLCVNRGGR